MRRKKNFNVMDLGRASKAVGVWKIFLFICLQFSRFTYTFYMYQVHKRERVPTLMIFFFPVMILNVAWTRLCDGLVLVQPLIFVVFLSVCQLAQPPSSNRWVQQMWVWNERNAHTHKHKHTHKYTKVQGTCSMPHRLVWSLWRLEKEGGVSTFSKCLSCFKAPTALL